MHVSQSTVLAPQSRSRGAAVTGAADVLWGTMGGCSVLCFPAVELAGSPPPPSWPSARHRSSPGSPTSSPAKGPVRYRWSPRPPNRWQPAWLRHVADWAHRVIEQPTSPRARRSSCPWRLASWWTGGYRTRVPGLPAVLARTLDPDPGPQLHRTHLRRDLSPCQGHRPTARGAHLPVPGVGRLGPRQRRLARLHRPVSRRPRSAPEDARGVAVYLGQEVVDAWRWHE